MKQKEVDNLMLKVDIKKRKNCIVRIATNILLIKQ